MKARGKERHRIKRLQKRKQARRLNSISPYRKLALHGRIHECLLSADWHKTGMIVTLTSVTGPTGLAAAGFLIDAWCCGLKDAWGYLDLLPEEVERAKERMSQQMTLVEVDVEEVRRLVAAGIRFAHQNGFRLPHRHDRWTSVIGGVGDWKTADLSRFGFQGGLHYMGTLDDLRQRLVACSAEEFLRRPGVHFTLGGPDGFWPSLEDDEGLHVVDGEDDEDGEFVSCESEDGLEEDEEDDPDEGAVEDATDAIVPGQPEDGLKALLADLHGVERDLLIAGIVRDARSWCMKNLMLPLPRLKEAAAILAESILSEDNETDAQVAWRATAMFSNETAMSVVSLKEAIAQLQKYTSHFGSGEGLLRSILAAANPASGRE